MGKLLTAHDLSVGYDTRGGRKVVRNELNLTLREGEFTSLLGVNGVGKSTLLRSLAGFQPLLGGELLLKGRPLNRISQRERAKLVSVVLTDQVVVGDLYAYEVVALGRHPYSGFMGRLRRHDHMLVERMMANVGVADLAKRRMSSLSDGERQKVMIAKALAQQTPLIILDEPTAFLDLPSRIEITLLLRNLCDTMGKTVLLSTHDLDLALDLSDKLWIMGHSNGFASGAPEDLVLEGRFNGFFERENIYFDQLIGRFRFKSEYTKTVRVEANERHLFWIEKALHRNGIGIEREDESDLKIVVREGESYPYLLSSDNDNSLEFKTIKELLRKLKRR